MNKVKILTPKGFGEIESIYVSDLNFLMLKINNLNGTYTTYNLGKHSIESNIFSNEILEDETVGSSRN
jgi:hypothetical protein